MSSLIEKMKCPFFAWEPSSYNMAHDHLGKLINIFKHHEIAPNLIEQNISSMSSLHLCPKFTSTVSTYVA